MKSLLLALLALPGIALARIGETPEECAKRYGKPASVESLGEMTTALYGNGGVSVTCWFLGGKCSTIAYQLITESRIDSPRASEEPQFTEGQTTALLAANSGGSKWERDGGDDFIPIFKTADGSRRARTGAAGVLIELTSEKARRAALLKPEAISKAIEGF